MKNVSNEELVKIAGETLIGTPSGLKAQGAQAELNKRMLEAMVGLKKSLDKNNEASNKFNTIIIVLTIVLAVLAVFQVIVSVLGTNFPLIIKFSYIILPIGVLYYGMRILK